MLQLSIALLVIGGIYALAIAPPAQRITIATLFVVLVVGGYAAGFALTAPNTDQRTFYPIAGAIAGAMIAFAWISHKRKSWPRQDDTKGDAKADAA